MGEYQVSRKRIASLSLGSRSYGTHFLASVNPSLAEAFAMGNITQRDRDLCWFLTLRRVLKWLNRLNHCRCSNLHYRWFSSAAAISGSRLSRDR